MSTAILAEGLVKTFGSTRALDGLGLEVHEGEVHGFLGPNGASKTTTIRILLGMMRATAGDVGLLGGDPWADATQLHRRLAYVPGDVTLWPTVSIIRRGRTVRSAHLADLRRERRTVVTAELAAQPLGLDRLPGVHDLRIDGSTITCRVDPAHLDDLLRALTAVGVRSLTSRPPSLEELFLAHYRQDEPVGAVR